MNITTAYAIELIRVMHETQTANARLLAIQTRFNAVYYPESQEADLKAQALAMALDALGAPDARQA